VCNRFFASDSIVDSILSKTTEGVMLEVRGRTFVLRILEAMNDTGAYFTLGGSAGENMAGPTFMILEGDVRFEERIDW
jgi:hypothetical protein